jgi:hypothetical protein
MANKATNDETFMKKHLILIINEINEQQQKYKKIKNKQTNKNKKIPFSSF